MTDHTDLTALIARLEAATGPDRELDCYIWTAINGNGQVIRRVGPPTYEPMRFFCNPNPDIEWLGYDLLNIAPAYTASLDAALTLVPKGYYADMKVAPHRKGAGALVWHNTEKNDHGDGPTYAIALCIAALKARIQ